jgi:predicted extracellular nuclease
MLKFRGLAPFAVALTFVFVLGSASTPTAGSAPSPNIVVSQVYGGGGNSGATLTNDFIELFNRGSSAVDVTGWSVQYASAAGTSWQRTNLSGSIAAGATTWCRRPRARAGRRRCRLRMRRGRSR